MHRFATWLLVVWTGLMGLGILAALMGIGADCVAPGGGELGSCLSDAWIRGSVGLMLLVFLWFVVAVPMWALFTHTRPKPNVFVYGPAGQQVMLPEDEAARRVQQPGWSYRNPTQMETGAAAG
jgi:hypothetical protein